MENTKNITKAALKESMLKGFTENKIFYLDLKARVIDAIDGTSVVRKGHLSEISFAEVFLHEDAFVKWCAKDIVAKYGKDFTTDIMCTSDWGEKIGDVDRTFTTLTWRDEKGEILAQIWVTASHMRECDCKIIPNYIVH
jgi:hypothetical protein